MNSNNVIAPVKKPLILVVDDVKKNLQVVGTTLIDEGYEISMANHGDKALKLLEKISPDLILLDIMMPDINGYQVCEKIKKQDHLKDIPIIFLTAKTELDDIVNGFKLGAVDYVTKPFKKEELLMRIKTHLELKFARETIEKNAKVIEDKNQQLEVSNNEKQELLDILNTELQLAAEYVQSLLPPKMTDGEFKTEWKFVPSAELSGDSFGYHWIDDDHFALYLLDVCGHGIGSALLSVSALNVIKFQTLPDTDFKEPAQVLSSLNKSFQMIDHNDIYFTIWYGVYNKNTHELKHACAGHHAALLLQENGVTADMENNNTLIGLMPETEYTSKASILPVPSKLYLFSDGAFEINLNEEGNMWSKDELVEYIKTFDYSEENEIEKIHRHLLGLHHKGVLDDDFSMLRITFP